MQSFAATKSNSLAVSCLAKPSAPLRRFLKRGSQPGHESTSKKTPAAANPARSEKLSEAKAIRLAQNGDAAAFECLYSLHSRRVYALCLRMVGDATKAEDLTQETFLLLFRKISAFRHESAFSTWLHRVTVNLVLMHLRKKSPPTVSIDPTPDSEDETGRPSVDVSVQDPFVAGSIDRINLERCIELLPVGYREIFVLHDIQGYEHHEIAEILGRSEGNSKSQLHKARKRLRELLHENQRERARNERLAARKVSARSSVVAA